MSISTLRDEKFAKEYEVTFETQSIEQAQQEWLKNNASKIQIDGFRPGKAPMQVMMSSYGSQAKEKALNKMLADQHLSFCNTNNVKDKELVKIEPVSDTTYKFLYEIPPQFDLIDPKAITVENLIYAPDETEVEEFLKELLLNMGEQFSYKEEDGHIAQDDDKVSYDITFTENGVVIEPSIELLKELTVTSIEPEGESTRPGYDLITKNLKGKKIGDTFDIKNVSFPDMKGAWACINGKTVDISVKVNGISAVRPREINDALFELLETENLETLKDRIRKVLATQKNHIIQTCHKRYIFDALDAAYNFEVSEEKVNQEFQNIWNDFLEEEKKFKEDNKEHPDMKGKTLEEVKDEYKKVAKRRIRLSYIIDKVREENKINLTQKDVENYGFTFFEALGSRMLEFWLWRMTQDENYRKEQFLIIHEHKIAVFLHSQATHTDVPVTEKELNERFTKITPS